MPCSPRAFAVSQELARDTRTRATVAGDPDSGWIGSTRHGVNPESRPARPDHAHDVDAAASLGLGPAELGNFVLDMFDALESRTR